MPIAHSTNWPSSKLMRKSQKPPSLLRKPLQQSKKSKLQLKPLKAKPKDTDTDAQLASTDTEDTDDTAEGGEKPTEED